MVVRSVEASHDSKPMQPGKVHLLSRLLILRFDPLGRPSALLWLFSFHLTSRQLLSLMMSKWSEILRGLRLAVVDHLQEWSHLTHNFR